MTSSSSSSSKTHVILHTPRLPPSSSTSTIVISVTNQLGVVFGRDPVRGYVTINAFKRTPSGELGDVEATGLVGVGHVLVAVDYKSVELLYFDDLMKLLRTRPKPYKLSFLPPIITATTPAFDDDESNNLNNIDAEDPPPLLLSTTKPPDPSPTKSHIPAYTSRDFETAPPFLTKRRLLMLLVFMLFLFIATNVRREEDEVVLEQAASPDEQSAEVAVVQAPPT